MEDFRQEDEIDVQTARTLNLEALQKLKEEQRPLLNEQYWMEFEEDFKFLVDDIAPILKHTEEIDQLLINSERESFAFVLNNFCDAVNKNCQSSLHFSVLLDRASNFFRRVAATVQQEALHREF